MKITFGEPIKNSSGQFKIDAFFYNELKRILELKPWHQNGELERFFLSLDPITQRTGQQNRSLHLFFTQLAEALNMAGLEMRKVLKAEIWWTSHSIKENLWRPLQKSMFGKESTTDLEKQVEIDKIHEQLMHLLGEKHGVEWIEFPSEKKEEPRQIDYPEDPLEPKF